VGDDWHSIDPSFIEAEVRESLQRLGTPPDFVLLHNPEFFLAAQLMQRVSIADAWDEMYERLAGAFAVLEKLCDEGVIASGYGVSSNFLSCSFSTSGRPNVYEALAIDRVHAVATSVGGEGHRLKIAQLPLNATEGGAVVGRGKVVPEAAEGDCSVGANLGLAMITNRPLHAIPVPGLSSGDWGRQGTSHLQLRDKKPMGTIEALLKRVLYERLGIADPDVPLQQVALRLAVSAPSVSCTLNGARSDRYIEDVLSVLREPCFSADQVSQALLATRAALQELGGQTRRFW
jgi:aryl-alcohol dehydrogenase-like predicted oxidoreductase